MKILITGSTGFLGSNFTGFFSKKGYEVIGSSRREMSFEFENYVGDLGDPQFTDEMISSSSPDVVINTVSLANVDECERDPGYAYEIVVGTAKNMAESAEKYGSRLLYISTDHLYDGRDSCYDEEAGVNPVNEYGRLKKLAEDEILSECPSSIIVRTNFFGWSPSWHTSTFGEWLYRNLEEQIEMNLFTDYYYTPIEVNHLAGIIERIISRDFSGILNIAGADRCSKYDFGMKMAELGNFDQSCIHPSTLSKSGLVSKRPGDLSLSTKKLRNNLGIVPPGLEESLISFLEGAQRI